MREIRIGDRIETPRAGTGTAIDLRMGQVLVSFYASGEQVWFNVGDVVRAGISSKK